ncbi:uncharacterized protein si:dkey-1h24.6 [Hippocampus zosterae]|uniref:uncharacterized protein si:dkey-1h24.6 n=1 Tax=Hippocampus zosterae TaxID=109293 RepID=UPI00223CE9C1|nr:uncharacterized protein si:dkey-1h24.6 [Hippocampus zosterae]
MTAWVIRIILGSMIAMANPIQGMCPCKYELQAVCKHNPATIYVPCPMLVGEDLTFALRKDEKVIHTQKCNSNKMTVDCEPNPCAELMLREVNTSVSFVLTGEMAKNGGLYRCEGTVTFPPPLKTEMSAVGILVHVEGHKCSSGKTKEGNGYLWIWITVLGVLCVYSIIITIIAVVNRVKVRQEQFQNDYINTKPRGTSQRERERGFRNTQQLYF